MERSILFEDQARRDYPDGLSFWRKYVQTWRERLKVASPKTKDNDRQIPEATLGDNNQANLDSTRLQTDNGPIDIPTLSLYRIIIAKNYSHGIIIPLKDEIGSDPSKLNEVRLAVDGKEVVFNIKNSVRRQLVVRIMKWMSSDSKIAKESDLLSSMFEFLDPLITMDKHEYTVGESKINFFLPKGETVKAELYLNRLITIINNLAWGNERNAQYNFVFVHASQYGRDVRAGCSKSADVTLAVINLDEYPLDAFSHESIHHLLFLNHPIENKILDLEEGMAQRLNEAFFKLVRPFDSDIKLAIGNEQIKGKETSQLISISSTQALEQGMFSDIEETSYLMGYVLIDSVLRNHHTIEIANQYFEGNVYFAVRWFYDEVHKAFQQRQGSFRARDVYFDALSVCGFNQDEILREIATKFKELRDDKT